MTGADAAPSKTQPAAWDVVVAGAGAAGLMAGIRAAELGQRVLLLEKNKRPGVKILMSGGTRCNITHATDNRGIVAAYGPPGRFLHSALAAFSVEDTIAFFNGGGVATKVEETGKIFPVSNKATDVLAALVNRLTRSGAELALEEPLLAIERCTEGFEIRTAHRTRLASKVILTTGGQSYPGSGTTGDGYRIAAKFGHTIVPPRPALVPITTDVAWVGELRGVTLPDVGVTLWQDKQRLAQRRGSLLFAHFGLSGPVILDISRVVSGHADPSRLRVEIDLLPDRKDMELDTWLRDEANASGKKQLAVILSTLLTRRIADLLLALAKLPLDRRSAALGKDDRGKLVHLMKHLPISITGTLGFKKAEVTAGGVALDEVDSRTMQSKLVPGLYLAGEILDLDGPIGGYNFQAAWSTGWLAGGSNVTVNTRS